MQWAERVMDMVGDAEKVVQTVEKVSGPVDISTMIATILIALFILIFIYKTIWPLLKKYIDEKMTKNKETEKNRQQLEEVRKSQENNEKQMTEMNNMVKELTVSTDKLCKQVQDISGGYKITISVLLDIINCMDGSTSPESCAKEAKEKVNAYFREGKLPPLVD
jgi:predicted PurR-regulated permease PerM